MLSNKKTCQISSIFYIKDAIFDKLFRLTTFMSFNKTNT